MASYARGLLERERSPERFRRIRRDRSSDYLPDLYQHRTQSRLNLRRDPFPLPPISENRGRPSNRRQRITDWHTTAIQPHPRQNMEFTIPFSSRTDPRIPYPRGTIPPEPIDLVDRDGYVSHSVTLLSPKCSAFSALVKLAVEKREETRHLYAEDVVERAVENNKLMHVSDGPRGGIWVIEKGRQDLAACLALDMPKGEEGGWEVLGVGGGGSEGKIFMIHGCGFGGPAIEKEVKGGEGNANGIKLKGKGKEKSIEVNAKNNEMQRNGIEAKGKENKGTKRRNRDRLRDLVGKMIDEVLLV